MRDSVYKNYEKPKNKTFAAEKFMVFLANWLNSLSFK
jgi:hypothetical protein